VNNETISPEIETILAAKRNVFITGSAGTGKSFLLNQLREKYDLTVTASTGAAAVNVSGTTIHSFSGVGIGDKPAQALYYQMRQGKRDAIQTCKMLAIDEISMLSAEMLDLIDAVFKLVRKSEEPFGGIQVIVIGDFLQLPPVSKDGNCRFAFESLAWEQAQFKVILLDKIYRQTDASFLDVLNNIRVGNPVEISSNTTPGNDTIRLYSVNSLADSYNLQKLRELKTPNFFYAAYDSGDAKGIALIDKHSLAPKELYLRVGARVMLLINKFDFGLVNGSMGTVVNLTPGEATVRFDDGGTISLGAEVASRVVVNKEEIARRTQIPLRLAWAISIHKSQGMTLDKVFIDCQGIFESGQVYVALSRVRKKEGLTLVNFRPEMVKANMKAVEFYRKLQVN